MENYVKLNFEEIEGLIILGSISNPLYPYPIPELDTYYAMIITDARKRLTDDEYRYYIKRYEKYDSGYKVIHSEIMEEYIKKYAFLYYDINSRFCHEYILYLRKSFLKAIHKG